MLMLGAGLHARRITLSLPHLVTLTFWLHFAFDRRQFLAQNAMGVGTVPRWATVDTHSRDSGQGIVIRTLRNVCNDCIVFDRPARGERTAQRHRAPCNQGRWQ